MNFNLTHAPRFQATPQNIFGFLRTGLHAVRATMTYATYALDAQEGTSITDAISSSQAVLPAMKYLEDIHKKFDEILQLDDTEDFGSNFIWRTVHQHRHLLGDRRSSLAGFLQPEPHDSFYLLTQKEALPQYMRTWYSATHSRICLIIDSICNERAWEYPAGDYDTPLDTPFSITNKVCKHHGTHQIFSNAEFERDIHIALIILIKNAFKHNGGKKPHIKLTFQADKIIIADEGIGMSRQLVKGLNDTNTSEPLSSDTNNWTTIKYLMRRHKRRYSVQSKKSGTTVTLHLKKGDIIDFDPKLKLTDALIPADKIIPAEHIVKAAAVFQGAQPLAGWQWVLHKGKCMLDVSKSPLFRYLPFAQDLVDRVQLSP